jgi:hypothetical protein
MVLIALRPKDLISPRDLAAGHAANKWGLLVPGVP